VKDIYLRKAIDKCILYLWQHALNLKPSLSTPMVQHSSFDIKSIGKQVRVDHSFENNIDLSPSTLMASLDQNESVIQENYMSNMTVALSKEQRQHILQVYWEQFQELIDRIRGL